MHTVFKKNIQLLTRGHEAVIQMEAAIIKEK
jgi:hypothetical protein